MATEYVMRAPKISDGYYVYWSAVGSPDYSATYSPVNPSLLTLPAVVDYSITSPTSGSGGLPYFGAGGDLSGTYPDPTVTGIQGVPIVAAPTANGQVLTYVSGSSNLQFKDAASETVVSTSTDYTTLSTDYLILVDSTSGAITIHLLSTPNAGKIQQIKDATGNAATHSITVNGNGKLIDGASSVVLNQNYENLSIIYNGSGWSVI